MDEVLAEVGETIVGEDVGVDLLAEFEGEGE